MRVLSFFLCAGLFAGCASSLSPPRESGIDAKYEWQRAQNSPISDAPGSPGVRFYQTALSDLLGSDCDYYPNDSAHAQMMLKRCGAGVAMVHSMARFFDEPNAPYLGYSVVPVGSVQRYKRLKVSCSWVD